jgi:hypothetical protein
MQKKKKKKSLKNNKKIQIILPDSFSGKWEVNMTNHYLVKKDD